MKAILLAAAIVFTASAGWSAQGRTDLRVFGAQADFSMELNDNLVTGSIFGFGGFTGGKVEMKKTETGWEGHLGMFRVTAKASARDEKGVSTVEVTTLPGGFHTYYVKYNQKKGRFEVTGQNSKWQSVSGRVEKEAKSMYVSNRFTDLSLDRRSDTEYRGFLLVRYLANHHMDNFSVDMKAEGELRPDQLAQKDPALFALVYLLPTNLSR